MNNNNMNDEKKWVIGSTLTIVVVFFVIIAIFWNIGLFDFTGTEASAKIVAGTIALVGTLLGTLVSIIGIFLKHSIDKRNADLKAEAEKRLNIEAATKAIDLLSTNTGEDVPETQRAAVLFTLATLEIHNLALTMLKQMIETDKIDMASAVGVIDLGLKSKDEALQYEASEILFNYSANLITEKEPVAGEKPLTEENNYRYSWPRNLDYKLYQDLCFYARQFIALTCLKTIVFLPYNKWSRPILNTRIVLLISIWKNEEREYLKNGVGYCLNIILNIYPKGRSLLPSSGRLYIDDLRKELSMVQWIKDKQNTIFIPIIDKLEQWIEDSKDTVTDASS